MVSVSNKNQTWFSKSLLVFFPILKAMVFPVMTALHSDQESLCTSPCRRNQDYGHGDQQPGVQFWRQVDQKFHPLPNPLHEFLALSKKNPGFILKWAWFKWSIGFALIRTDPPLDSCCGARYSHCAWLCRMWTKTMKRKDGSTDSHLVQSILTAQRNLKLYKILLSTWGIIGEDVRHCISCISLYFHDSLQRLYLVCFGATSLVSNSHRDLRHKVEWQRKNPFCSKRLLLSHLRKHFRTRWQIAIFFPSVTAKEQNFHVYLDRASTIIHCFVTI